MNRTRVPLLAFSALAAAAAPSWGTDLVTIRVGTFTSSNTAEYVLTEAGLTHHVVADRWAPLTQYEIWDDASASNVPMMDANSREIARLDSMDYSFADQSWNGWFTPDPFRMQTGAFGLTANADEDIWVQIRMPYQGTTFANGWPYAMTAPDGSTWIDDRWGTELSLRDNNADGVRLIGMLPGQMSLRHMYEIPSIGYSQVAGAFASFIFMPNSNGLAGWGSGYQTQWRPASELEIYSEAYFRLSAGDTFGLTMDRGVPAPGASVLLLAAAAIVVPRRRR
ncbi:MAG: hypothetical protein ACOYN0_10590 [Phycisphaerales bacterium]